VPAGASVPVQLLDGLAAPHGLVLTAGGSLLVSDTGHDAILRVDPLTGRAERFAGQESPLGLALAADGSVYVCDDLRKRIVHFSPSGERLGFVGPVLDVPYGLAADPAGGVYVTEARTSGRVKHVAPDGTVTTLSTL
jgi:serine/threonine-protein kinase